MDIQPMLEEIVFPLPVDKKDGLIKELATYLNGLLLHDFQALVELLYRVDVSETKLKAILKDHPEKNAGELIAGLLIERQEEKIAAKKKFSSPHPESDEERW